MTKSKGRTTVTAKTQQGISHTITGTNPYGPPMEIFNELTNETYIRARMQDNPPIWKVSIHSEESDTQIEVMTTIDVKLEYAIDTLEPKATYTPQRDQDYGDVGDDFDY